MATPSKQKQTPVEAEAIGQETLPVTWRDMTFQVPADRMSWPFDAALAFEEGRYLTGIAELLSREDMLAFRATRPDMRDGFELLNAILDTFGLPGLGESPASSV